MGEQGVQQRAEDTPLEGPVLRVSVEEVLLPILTACSLPLRKPRIQLQLQGGVQTQGSELGVELEGNNCVEC